MSEVATIRAKFESLRPFLDERRRRLWAATEALALGRGGVTVVAQATALRRNTIQAGIRELQTRAPVAAGEPVLAGPDRGSGPRAEGARP